ncbi:MAG: hypothetical protein ISN26_07790 [Betaproteobacteria bacterium AqS2]|uniref:Uncharacterized protein n=1 Tax=Candidatus Amphirhobacter heronislandensis TaxID=1732024 RepID=A0A930UHQ3_9GAMM|nr:hypothetical protein [Betaproteobacteria bacterium AqS2]
MSDQPNEKKFTAKASFSGKVGFLRPVPFRNPDEIYKADRQAATTALEGERQERMQKRWIKWLAVTLAVATLLIVPLANNYCYWHYPFTGSLKCAEEASCDK